MTITPTASAAVLRLPAGMVGLPQAHEFVLTGGEDGVFEMECLDEPGLGFVVVAPGPFFPDYRPEIDDETATRLGLGDASEALVLLVVTLGSDDVAPSANLLAPVVVNRTSGVAAQVVLHDQELPLRAPFLQG